MVLRKISFSFLFMASIQALPIAEEFKQQGYVEISDRKRETGTFTALYTHFDTFIEFMQTNPVWERKLYNAKERFIRSKEKPYYSTDFFCFYDESKRAGRNQTSFYYSTHFHDFLSSCHPEIHQVPEIIRFLEACLEIQKPCKDLFVEAAIALGLEAIFPSNHPPVLFKVVKYFPEYIATTPHYDGTAFSLFLDSTDNESLLLSPYKSSFAIADFFSPFRGSSDSILLIPGTLLTEFSIAPTPHIVAKSGKIRHATIAFAMRPNYTPPKIRYTPLPSFK